MFRHNLSRRDVFLVLLGAFSMQIWTLLFRDSPSDQSILVNAHFDNHNHHHPIGVNKHLADNLLTAAITSTATMTVTETVTEAVSPPAQTKADTNTQALLKAEGEWDNRELPHTSIVAHAPGWTLFNNLYMSNGTLFILTSRPETFPEIRLMTSTGLPAENTPENIALREPTKENMDLITPEDALERWGGDPDKGKMNRVWTIGGNTVRVIELRLLRVAVLLAFIG
jgi:hypothetical protein